LAYPPLRHTARVTSARIGPKGNRIVTSSEDGTVRVWEARTGRPLHTFTIDQRVARVVFSPDGQMLAAAAGDRVFRWDTATGKPQGQPIHVGDPTEYVAYSPDGGKLVTAGPKGFARVWDASSGKSLSGPLPHRRLSGNELQHVFDAEGTFESRRWPRF